MGRDCERRRVIGYLRVSTNLQAERGYGLDVQQARVADFCRAERFQLVHVFTDPGVSATTALHERPGLSAALELVRAGKADALVCARIDRIARSTLQALLIEQEFTAAGAELLYAEGPIWTSGYSKRAASTRSA